MKVFFIRNSRVTFLKDFKAKTINQTLNENNYHWFNWANDQEALSFGKNAIGKNKIKYALNLHIYFIC